jgi:hypothetical protein
MPGMSLVYSERSQKQWQSKLDSDSGLPTPTTCARFLRLGLGGEVRDQHLVLGLFPLSPFSVRDKTRQQAFCCLVLF